MFIQIRKRTQVVAFNIKACPAKGHRTVDYVLPGAVVIVEMFLAYICPVITQGDDIKVGSGNLSESMALVAADGERL